MDWKTKTKINLFLEKWIVVAACAAFFFIAIHALVTGRFDGNIGKQVIMVFILLITPWFGYCAITDDSHKRF